MPENFSKAAQYKSL